MIEAHQCEEFSRMIMSFIMHVIGLLAAASTQSKLRLYC